MLENYTRLVGKIAVCPQIIQEWIFLTQLEYWHLKGTSDTVRIWGSHSGKTEESNEFEFEAFCDINWAGDKPNRDATSCSRFIIKCAGGPIIWKSEKTPKCGR